MDFMRRAHLAASRTRPTKSASASTSRWCDATLRPPEPPRQRPHMPRAGRLRVEVVEEVGVHRGPSSAVPSSRPIEEKWFGLSRYPPWSCRVQDPALPLQKPRNGLGATGEIRACCVGVYPNTTAAWAWVRALVTATRELMSSGRLVRVRRLGRFRSPRETVRVLASRRTRPVLGIGGT